MHSVWTLRHGAGIIVLAALAGCSSVGDLLGPSDTGQPAPAQSRPSPATTPAPDAIPPKDSLTDMILGKPSTAPGPGDQMPKPADDDNLTCPEVTVRSGAGTLLIGSKGSIGEVNAMDLRYQGTLVKFARECKSMGGNMTMKIGIEGRIITGPAGGPGQVEVPLRLAVVQEGPNPRTVLSKLARIPVTITAETPTVDFTHIDPDVAFPMPRPISELDYYVVYVGFDPTAAAQKPPPRRKR